MKTVGRPLEFSPKDAIDAATEVFWCRGYGNASMTELLTAMGLSKSSMYQSFGSKSGLFRCCLDRYATAQAESMQTLFAQSGSGRAFIKALFASIANTAGEPDGEKGCLVVNSINEFGQHDPEVAMTIGAAVHPINNVFFTAIQRAQHDGEIAADANPAALANYMHVAISGLRTMIKTGMDKQAAQTAAALLLKALD